MTSPTPKLREVSPSQLTRRYVLALATTALALLGAQATLQPEFARQQQRLEAVGQVGRQRLLSSRVAEQALSCALPGQSTCALEQALGELRTGHDRATSGQPGLPLLEGAGLNEKLARILALAPAVIAAPEVARVGALRQACADYNSAIDAALARAMTLLGERETRVRLQAGSFFVMVLGLMVFQGLYVFRPAVRSVSQQLAALTRANDELKASLDHVKQLQGLLPICMHCKRIRDEQQNWQRIETYLNEHADLKFTHALCTECLAKYYPDEG